MADEATPKDKAELLERVRREYAALEQVIGRLSEAQLTAPIDGSWSAKDILAHIAAWQQILLGFHIGGRPFDQAAPGIAASYQTDDVDTINEALYQRDRERPWRRCWMASGARTSRLWRRLRAWAKPISSDPTLRPAATHPMAAS
jgi:hypothetical protein